MPEHLSQFLVKIDGSSVSQELMNDVIEIVVDSSLYLPGMFTILLSDDDLKWVDDASLAIGKEVEITSETSDEMGGITGLLIKGEIAALEPDFSAQGRVTMLIRGYDKSHRLHRGKKTRTFLNQKDDAIVKTLAGEAGLTPEVDATTVTYDYVIQKNETNMEFLQSRAERLGYKVFSSDGKLYFKKGDASLGTGPELKLGETLLSFHPSLAATHQVDAIKVLGWDHKQKKAIQSEVTPPAAFNQGGMTQTGGDTAQSAFGSAEAILVNRPVSTADEAKALATGLAHDIGGESMQAEGVCLGHAEVKAGYTIQIKGVGTRFSGDYFVTSATHVWNVNGYETRFSISGRQPNTVSHLLESGNGHAQGRGLVWGVVTGLVTNLNDPDDLGRVKVKYGWLGDDIESDWVRIATPMGGAERGFFYLPEVNDEVLIAFEHGDIHHPYIVGSLWSSTDKPPSPNSDVVASGTVNQRIIKSRSGHVIILDDTDGSEQIVIRDKTESNEIIIDSANNTITINVDADFSSDAQGATTIQSTGKITLKSSDDLSIECKNFTVKAQMNATVEGTVGVTVKNAAAEVALSGPTVNINKGALEVT